MPGLKNIHKFTIRKEFDIGFDEAMAIQLDKAKELKKDRSKHGLLLMVEHSPIVTMGRGGSENNLIAGKEALSANGIEYHEARRGGDVTYHGPGQITMYPVFPLEWYWRDLHLYMRTLEETGINYLKGYAITAAREKGLTGVWVDDKKIAAIGIAVSGWVTYYGMAFNICPDMRHFSLIRPCGIEHKGVTSLAELTGKNFDVSEEMDKLAENFCTTFGNTEILNG